MKNKKILVTGGTGLVGSHLLRQLLENGATDVRAIRRHESRLDLVADFEKKIEWLEADVNDLPALEDAFQNVEQVFHCAAMVSFHPSDLRKMMHVNVAGTANVVNLCLEKNIEKLVHVSSIAAIGRSKERPHLSEKNSWQPGKLNSNYAISKYLSEMEVWRGEAEGLKIGIVNPSIILGSGFWGSGSTRFFQQVFDGLKFYPIGRSGFVDVEDVARFMILLMNSEISSERYILNSENLSFQEIFTKIAAALQVPPPKIRAAPWLAEVAWRVEWLKEKILGSEPMVTRESARTSSNSFFYENEKSRSVFDFQYRSVDETVARVAEAFLKSQKHLK